MASGPESFPSEAEPDWRFDSTIYPGPEVEPEIYLTMDPATAHTGLVYGILDNGTLIYRYIE